MVCINMAHSEVVNSFSISSITVVQRVSVILLSCYLLGPGPQHTAQDSLRLLFVLFQQGLLWAPFILPCMCYAQSLQLCPALCNPMHCSPPGSSVHRILQARILEWVVMPSSRGSSQPRDQTRISLSLQNWQAGSLALYLLGSPSFSFGQCQSCAHSRSSLCVCWK